MTSRLRGLIPALSFGLCCLLPAPAAGQLLAATTLSVDRSGTGDGAVTVTSTIGTVYCGPGSICTLTYPWGAQVTLSATAEFGSVFAGWEGCSGAATCTVTMDAGEKPVVAKFTALPRVFYYDHDAIGSTRLVTDEQGAVVEFHNYTPFGVEQTPTTGFTPRLFAGKQHDSETAFDYFGGRYLSSSAARFTTVDPLMDADAALTEPQRWNRYAYSLNNPIRLVDPDGRQPLEAQLLRMLELLKTPRTAAGAIRGPLIQTVTDHTLGPLLGEMFGYPPSAARGGLRPAEYRQLMDVSSYEKGATMLGMGEGNAEAIDAVDLTNRVGVSLKTAANAMSLVRGAEHGRDQVERAKFFNVRMYIHANTVPIAEINLERLGRVLGDRITKIVVFAKDGTVQIISRK